ncbi:MAG: hypothetical protein H6606_00140 [Flavobacteriales bacterium]|nr:hypothetical protein [Flavobacteriales bacterium]
MLPKWITILLLSVFSLTAAGQTHQWAVQLPTSANGASVIISQTQDDSSNIYVGGTFRDSLYFTDDTLFFSNGLNQTLFVAKYDGEGNFIWAKAFKDVTASFLCEIAVNSKSEVVLYGSYINHSLSKIPFGKDTLSRRSAVFIAFLSVNGEFTAARDLAFSYTCLASALALNKKDEIHVAFYVSTGGYGISDGNTVISGTGYNYVAAKFSSDASELEWTQIYSTQNVRQIFDITTDRFDQVYYSIITTRNGTIHGKMPGDSSLAGLVWIRPDGQFKDVVFTELNDQIVRITDVCAIDSAHIYVSG